MPYLIGLTGPYTDEIIEVKDGTTRVGRGPACDLVLDRDPAVSRAHATLVSAGGVVRVQDAGSTHGTYVNGRRVDQALLRTRDCVQFGGSLFQVQPVPAQVSESPRLKVVVPRAPALPPGMAPGAGAAGAAGFGVLDGEPVISTSGGCLWLGLALLFPFPIGLGVGFSYLRKKHPGNRQFGGVVLVLSVVSLIAQVVLGIVLSKRILSMMGAFTGPMAF
ncbi:MAG: FHA domain-containing protein [Armatimonadetes bacterium]|nr:FHA domain-containing protein [Armatimonadota bacterium]